MTKLDGRFGKGTRWTLVVVGITLMMGCGKQGGGTIVRSSAISAGAVGALAFAGLGSELFAAATIPRLSFCLSGIRLEDESNESHGGDGNGEITFEPGLIDIKDGVATQWGSVTVPLDFALAEIKIKVKKNQTACGVSYAVKVNDVSTEEEVELNWKLNPPRQLKAGEAVEINLQAFVTKMIASGVAGTLNQNTIKTAIEAVEDSFEIKSE